MSDKPKPLYMVTEDDCSEWWLYNGDPKWHSQYRIAEDKEITLFAMAEMMDHNEENNNYHHLVGCYHSLACILMSEVGDKKATTVMREIVDRGGLRYLKVR